LYASDAGAQSPAQYPSIDIITDDEKMRQASTARMGGSTALLDKVMFYYYYSCTYCVLFCGEAMLAVRDITFLLLCSPERNILKSISPI